MTTRELISNELNLLENNGLNLKLETYDNGKCIYLVNNNDIAIWLIELNDDNNTFTCYSLIHDKHFIADLNDIKRFFHCNDTNMNYKTSINDSENTIDNIPIDDINNYLLNYYMDNHRTEFINTKIDKFVAYLQSIQCYGFYNSYNEICDVYQLKKSYKLLNLYKLIYMNLLSYPYNSDDLYINAGNLLNVIIDNR